MNYDLVLHMDSDDPRTLSLAFSNVTNYRSALQEEEPHIVLVANGPAVKRFTVDDRDAARQGDELSSQGLAIRLCANALRAFEVPRDRLWPCVSVVPAGLVELVRLQRAGYAYVKP